MKIRVIDTHKVQDKLAQTKVYHRGIDVGEAVANIKNQTRLAEVRATWFNMLEQSDRDWRVKLQAREDFHSKRQKRRERTAIILSTIVGAGLTLLALVLGNVA